MADPARSVPSAPTAARAVPWAAFKSVRITGHDGNEARLVCLLCDASQPAYLVRGSLAVVIRWAVDHWQFLHQTQVAARE